jgi:hypothetical protein
MPHIGETCTPVFSLARTGRKVAVCAALAFLPVIVSGREARAQTSAVETQRQPASQSEDESELPADLARSPMMQLKPRLNGVSLNQEFGKADADTEESRFLPALSFVKIVETRRAPDYGPLWSMVVGVHQNGTPLRTHDGKMIKGWVRTDHFVPPAFSEPVVASPPKVSVAATSADDGRRPTMATASHAELVAMLCVNVPNGREARVGHRSILDAGHVVGAATSCRVL